MMRRPGVLRGLARVLVQSGLLLVGLLLLVRTRRDVLALARIVVALGDVLIVVVVPVLTLPGHRFLLFSLTSG